MTLDEAAAAYRDFLGLIEREHGLRMRVLPDILTGASAGGMKHFGAVNQGDKARQNKLVDGIVKRGDRQGLTWRKH